jgi:hypothetical protein
MTDFPIELTPVHAPTLPCSKCGGIPARFLITDPEFSGAVCGTCCVNYLVKMQHDGVITSQQLNDFSKALIDQASEDKLSRVYVALVAAGLIVDPHD